jgi:hypothetical protein
MVEWDFVCAASTQGAAASVATEAIVGGGEGGSYSPRVRPQEVAKQSTRTDAVHRYMHAASGWTDGAKRASLEPTIVALQLPRLRDNRVPPSSKCRD